MILRFKPTKDRVLIEPIFGGNETVGSIAVPEQYRDTTPTEGIVAAVGPQVDTVKVGERVIFPRHEGERITIGEKFFKLFHQQDLLALIN